MNMSASGNLLRLAFANGTSFLYHDALNADFAANPKNWRDEISPMTHWAT